MLRSRLNPEEQTNVIEGPTRYAVGANRSALRCGMCGGVFYVDENARRMVAEALENGFDNPFLCADCEEEYDELAYEG